MFGNKFWRRLPDACSCLSLRNISGCFYSLFLSWLEVGIVVKRIYIAGFRLGITDKLLLVYLHFFLHLVFLLDFVTHFRLHVGAFVLDIFVLHGYWLRLFLSYDLEVEGLLIWSDFILWNFKILLECVLVRSAFKLKIEVIYRVLFHIDRKVFKVIWCLRFHFYILLILLNQLIRLKNI